MTRINCVRTPSIQPLGVALQKIHRIILIFAILGAGCATVETGESVPSQKQIARDAQEESKLGKGIALGIIQQLGVDQTLPAPLRTQILEIGQAIIKEYGRPGVTHYLEILDSDEANAYATPGGYIFLTRGLLLQMNSLDELSAVIGHELAHVNEQHLYKVLKAGSEKKSGIYILARLLGGGSSDIGAALSKAVQRGIELLLKKGLDPELEKAADEIGVSYSATLGFNPEGLEKLILRLDQTPQASASSDSEKNSHLLGESRANWIRSRIEHLGLIDLSKHTQQSLSQAEKKWRASEDLNFRRMIRNSRDSYSSGRTP